MRQTQTRLLIVFLDAIRALELRTYPIQPGKSSFPCVSTSHLVHVYRTSISYMRRSPPTIFEVFFDQVPAALQNEGNLQKRSLLAETTKRILQLINLEDTAMRNRCWPAIEQSFPQEFISRLRGKLNIRPEPTWLCPALKTRKRAPKRVLKGKKHLGSAAGKKKVRLR